MTSNQRIFRALFAVALILGIAMGTRNAFSGLFLQPVSADMKWGREVFSFAVALQNLVWGASQPFIGYIADRYGARRVLMAGAVLYALGLGWTAFLSNTFTLAISGGILMGVAIACTTYSVAYSVLGKMVPPERRAWAFGISAAAGSFGQFFMIPVGQFFITQNGWSASLIGLAVITATIAPLGWYFAKLGSEGKLPQPAAATQASAGEALRTAFADRSYTLLTLGYFVCGFQVSSSAPISRPTCSTRASLREWALPRSRWSACSTASALISRACSPASCPSATRSSTSCVRW